MLRHARTEVDGRVQWALESLGMVEMSLVGHEHLIVPLVTSSTRALLALHVVWIEVVSCDD